MKLNSILWLSLLFFLSSCSKEEKDHHIKAGEIGFRIYECLEVEDDESADLNRNDHVDVKLSSFYVDAVSGYLSKTSVIVYSDSFQILMTNDSRVPKKLAKGDFINHEGHWLHQENGHILTLKLSSPSGNRTVNDWKDTKAYIGVRYEYVSGSYKYGWLRVNMKDDFELMSYAMRK